MRHAAFFIALGGSLGIHAGILFLSTEKRAPELKFQKGADPVEVSTLTKPGVGRARETQPAKSVVPSVAGGGEAVPSAPVVSAAEGGGITDGSELGIKPPVYPSMSRLRGEEGPVLVQLVLDTAGGLEKVEVLESSGFTALDRAALVAVERALPPARTDLPRVEKKVRFHFRLR